MSIISPSGSKYGSTISPILSPPGSQPPSPWFHRLGGVPPLAQSYAVGNHSVGAWSVVAASSGDFGVLGEVFGDFDADFRSAGFDVGGGVSCSDADFSVSFFEAEDSECLCLRRLGGPRCFWPWPSVDSPLVWGLSVASAASTGFSSPCSCSLVSSGADVFLSSAD